MTDRTIVVGDIHGCSDTLRKLLESSCNISSKDRIIFLGDLMDKGLKSKETLDFVLELIANGNKVDIIRGNHEQMFLDSINSPQALKKWFRNGGKETLDSFEVYNPGFIDEVYIELINSTVPYLLVNDFVITHAGLNFDISNPLHDTLKMQTIRNAYCDTSKIDERRLIVGHTPYDIDKIINSLKNDLIYLDGGCVYNKKVQGLGNLVALELNEMELFYIKNID